MNFISTENFNFIFFLALFSRAFLSVSLILYFGRKIELNMAILSVSIFLSSSASFRLIHFPSDACLRYSYSEVKSISRLFYVVQSTTVQKTFFSVLNAFTLNFLCVLCCANSFLVYFVHVSTMCISNEDLVLEHAEFSIIIYHIFNFQRFPSCISTTRFVFYTIWKNSATLWRAAAAWRHT